MGVNEWGYDDQKYDAALEELHKRVKGRLESNDSYPYDERFVARFLRARKLDVDQSEKMLLDCLSFRAEHRLDTILEREPEAGVAAFLKYWPSGIAGHTKDGLRVYYERIGSSKIHEVLGSYITVDQAVEAKLRSAELGERQSRDWHSCDRKRTIVMILDLGGSDVSNGVSLSMGTKPHLEFQRRIGSVLESVNPETCERIVVLNAGQVFAALWKVFKGFYTEEVRKKLTVLRGPSEYMPVLREMIDDELIPDFLPGGKLRVDEAWAGDLKYMSTLPLHESHEGMEHRETVGAGKTHVHTLDVPQGRCVQYAFCTEGHDIGFKVTRGSDELVPHSRIRCANDRQTGTVGPMPEGGPVSVIFDNGYSMMRGKTVRFCVRVT